MKTFLIKNKIYLLASLLVLVFMIGCWEFLSIEQPEFADPNSTFNVPISVSLTPEDYSSRGYFGIRLPVGWSVEDSISYAGIMSGTFIYSKDHSDSMEVYENSNEGYYWWVGVCDSVDSLLEGNISLTPRITTDGQSGMFLIDYMLSDRIGQFSDYIVHSGPYPISVGLPMTATVTNTNNDGSGSLRQALADVSSGGQIIFDLSYPATITLESQLVVDRSMTILGPDSGELTISGDNKNRVFFINKNLRADIFNLKISNGNDISYGGRGGGIYCFGSNLSLFNIVIDNNSANSGGGIFFKSEEERGELKNVDSGFESIKKQLTNYSGNANGDNHTLNLTNVIISNNSAADDGGGIHCPDGNLVLKKVTIFNNEATGSGGGICSSYGKFVLTNSTIVNNSAADGGGGICGYSCPTIIVNSIIWKNDAHRGAGFYFEDYIIDIAYSDIQGSWPGSNNINQDPMFVDAANGDYSLQAGSPCIDVGTAFFEFYGDTVLNLNPGQYSLTAPDMGAYEFDTDDALIATISPDKGYQNYNSEILIKCLNIDFLDNKEALDVWLSHNSESIKADSVVVQSNTYLLAFFYIPMEASTVLWDVNVKTDTDDVLKKENSFEILPSPALISVSPDSLNISLESGTTITHSLTIQNNGDSDLNYDIFSRGQNYALKFDGIDDYVEIPDVINNGDFSIELWFNLDTEFGGYLYSSTKDYTYFDLSVNSTNIHWQFESANDDGADIIVSGLNLIIGEWYHLVATGKFSSNGPHKLFLNGLEIASNSMLINHKGSLNSAFIGQARVFDYHFGVPNLKFGGSIDEVRIWDKILSLQEIQYNMYNNLNGTEPGLSGYWNFNEKSGDLVFDLTSKHNHGSLNSGVSRTIDTAPIEPGWLSAEPDSGICPAKSTSEIILSFDASELEPGDYSGRLIFSSNDPFNPKIITPIQMFVSDGTVIVKNLDIPKEFKLQQNHPNPFNPSTTIEFNLPKSEYVELKVYNILGKEVTTLVSRKLNQGNHTYQFDGKNLASGIYYYQLVAGDYREVKKMILLK